ncbi:glycosyltransferase [Acaryochloris sp. IP29b_bin.137]|uniref:glycosyltransferase family 2 protein n=1 Tax=Acaryochloris sp. IP29b_bin.137 TaxID=2969217 RepID=UPI00261F7F49|nr:glycosyltransferase [Acaryochloris sp. IP29b_bin.137]
MKVSICIITFLRPDGLKRLLIGIANQKFKQIPMPNLEVIVVDNDVKQSAQPIIQQMGGHFPCCLRYDVEEQRGIPFARNRSVANASDDTDFIAFIDDDEVPDAMWLERLLLAQQSYQADAVVGPVLPKFSHRVHDWIQNGKFFERPRHPSGFELSAAATNNTLVKAEILRRLDFVFDERMALTGGSDWHLFRRLYGLGHKLVWADDALVYEWIPESRTNLRWILQRGYRCGNTEALCEMNLNPSVAVLLMFIFKGGRRIVRGLLLVPLSYVRGKHIFFKNLKYISHSFGIISGVLGTSYEEYQVIHRT